MSTVTELSSDEFRGRDNRDASAIEAAAEFIARAHADAKTLPVGGTYLHPFSMPIASRPSDRHQVWVDIGGRSRQVPQDSFTSLAMGSAKPRLGGVVSVGGGTPAELEGLALRRKIALATSGPGSPVELASRLVHRGAAGLVLVQPEQSDRLETPEALAGSELPVVLMRESTALAAFPTLPTDDPWAPGDLPNTLVSLSPVQVQEFAAVPNVIAYLPGRTLPHEVVLVGAHYDHIGTERTGVHCRDPDALPDESDAICNGADDNASGTAVVLEVARLLAAWPDVLARTVVFAHFAGEELGLQGARALSETPPSAVPFEGSRIVAMLNFDMVGRYEQDPGLTIGSVSSSEAWPTLLDAIDHRGLTVHYERAVSNRSDHVIFHRRQIPVLFFFTGLHGDYHRTTDEAHAVNAAALASIAGVAFDLTLSLARGAAIDFRSPADPSEGETSRLPTAPS